ncbi:MAG: glycosyltransferase family 39 protein [bacterium]
MKPVLLGVAIAAAILAQLSVHAEYGDRLGWLGLALATALAAAVAGQPGDIAGAPARRPQRRPHVLWGAAAVAAIAATTILGSLGQRPILGLVLWLASIPLGVQAVRGWQVTPARRRAVPWSRGEGGILLAVLLLAALARTLWLDALPRSIFGDEPRVAMYLRQAFPDGPSIKSFFIMGWNTWPAIGLTLQGALVPLLGLGVTALRASSALMGTLGVLATYLLARELSGPRLALCAALLLAVCRTAIDFSRLGITHAQILCLEPLALFHLWRALNGGRAVHWLLAGVVCGWCLYSYNAGQLVPPLVVGWLALGALRHPSHLRTHWRGAALLVAGLALIVFPYVYFFTDAFRFGPNWEQWTTMARNRQTLGRVVEAWHEARFAAAWEILSRQIWMTWLGFGVIPGGGYPLGYRQGGMLDDVTAALFTLGVGVSLRRLARAREAFVLYWFVATVLVGGIATVNPPSFVRMVGLLPALAMLGALPLDALAAGAGAAGWRRGLATVAVGGLIAAAAWINWRTYFVEFAASPADATSELARFLERRPADEATALLGAEYFLACEQELFEVEHQGRCRDIAEAAHFLPLHESSGPLTVILAPTQQSLTAYVQALYPGAEVADVSLSAGAPPIFRAVHLTAEQTRSRTGLALRAENPDGARDDAPRDPFASLPAALAEARSLTWSGAIYWPSSRALTLRVAATRPTTITIGTAEPVEAVADTPSSARLTLPRGWQPIRIDERGGGAHRLELTLSDEAGSRLLTRWQFRPEAGAGLRATYTQPDGAVVESIDPQLNSFAIEGSTQHDNERMARMPFIATWRGLLRVDLPGEYRFDAIGSGPYAVRLDGTALLEVRQVAVPEEPIEATQRRVLSPGLHPIEATFDSTRAAHTRRRIFQLFWTPPGGEKALIPPTQFVLEDGEPVRR